MENILIEDKQSWMKFQDEISKGLKEFSIKITKKLSELKNQRENISEEVMNLIESIIIKLKSQLM